MYFLPLRLLYCQTSGSPEVLSTTVCLRNSIQPFLCQMLFGVHPDCSIIRWRAGKITEAVTQSSRLVQSEPFHPQLPLPSQNPPVPPEMFSTSSSNFSNAQPLGPLKERTIDMAFLGVESVQCRVVLIPQRSWTHSVHLESRNQYTIHGLRREPLGVCSVDHYHKEKANRCVLEHCQLALEFHGPITATRP